MKYAIVDDNKSEATPGARGSCQVCGSEMIARCGEKKVWHWAHKGKRYCDTWWENETEWHRSWKNHFPADWQEFVHRDEKGERHIADVKTDSDWTLEFQYSYLKPEERRSRNSFYNNLIWIVSGNRRKTDKTQFQRMLGDCIFLSKNPPILKANFPDECRLIQEWHDSNVLVFFDFGETPESNQTQLWFLFPLITPSEAYLSPFSKSSFIELHQEGKFDETVKKIILPIHQELKKSIIARRSNSQLHRPSRLHGFERYLAKRKRRRRRF